MDPFEYLRKLNDPSSSSGRYNSVNTMLAVFLNFIMGVGIGVSIIGGILAGIQYTTSRGDFKAMDKAKHSLTYAIIAMVLSVGAFAVKTLVFSSIGWNISDEVTF